MAGKGADEEDTCQLGGAHVLMLDVLRMKVMKVKGLVTDKVLLALVQVKVLVLVFVVKAFVVEEVFLSSLSSTSFPRTRPAARVWASGAKGLGFHFAAPAPGQRCSGPFPETRPLA